MMCKTLIALMFVLAAMAAAATAAPPEIDWNRTILTEDFGFDPSWTYVGVPNGSSQDLIRYDGSNQNAAAEWDQSNNFVGWPNDPYTIQPSSYSTSLGTTLTDGDTFRFGATVRVSGVPNTIEFYQIANFGLYNQTEMGPDRSMSDNLSDNANIVKDASDFVEWNYFIMNDSFGWNPFTEPTIGAHIITGLDGDYITGSGTDTMWHNTDMGKHNWLPEDTDLYVEVTYYGDGNGEYSRRAYGAVYTDAAHTNLLSVNGVEQYYWTVPVPDGKSFSLTDFAFYNYVGSNWGGANGEGTGSFDDVYVQTGTTVPEPATAMLCLMGLAGIGSRIRRRLRR